MKTIPVLLLGAGGVGRALIQQIIDGRETVAARAGIRLTVRLVADSQRWVRADEELTDADLHNILLAKQKRETVGEPRPDPAEMVAVYADQAAGPAILVDVTAADGMEPALNAALDQGYGVVLANKKPLAGPWATAGRFFNNPLVRHESTVGGGQPVIATLRYLLDTKDEIRQIEGQMSGTLGFICGRLDAGASFSEALAEARLRGYTEPDPREDLSGQDVMRKALILGRMAGWSMEASDIAVETLYPSALAHLSVMEFMQASVALNPAMADRVTAAAAASGEVLRYVASVANGKGTVGLEPVPMGSALASLKYVSFRTGRYDDEPLMIGGKGAGVDMTAAGVIGDLIALARETMPA